jgi:hypothetical protein
MTEVGNQGGGAGNRWHGRPFLAAITRVGVFLRPIVASILAAMLVAAILPSPKGTTWLVAWWAVMLVIPTIVLVVCQRLARRLVPLINDPPQDDIAVS